MDGNKRKDRLLPFVYYTGLFLLLLGVVIFFHAVNGYSFIYNVDAPLQDYPAFLYLGKLLRHFFATGEIRLYDFSIGLGGDVISTLNSNGVGDPLNLFSVFAVGRAAVYVYEFTLFLRWYLCGAGMLLFCRKHGKDAGLSVTAAMLYPFSAFALPNALQYYQIMNAAYILPLLLIQIEELAGQKEKARGEGVKFSLLIALQACCSFYFLYIQTILIFVYALTEYFVCHPKDFKNLWKKVLYVSVYYFRGIMLSGVLLFPAVAGFLQSARMESGISGKLYFFWSAEELLLKLENLFVHKRSAMLAASLGISILALLAVMDCWLGRDRKVRVLSLILTAAYASPFVWSMMNGFSYPGTRWIYVIFFAVSYATVLLIEHCDRKTGRGRLMAAAAVFAVSMGYHYSVQADKIRTGAVVMLAAAFVWTLSRSRENRRKKLMCLCMVTLFCNVVLLEGPYQICGQELYSSFMPRAEMEALALSMKETESAREWHRVDRQEKANQGALLQGYQGCWAYYSIMNANIWSFYDALKISPAMQSSNQLYGLDGRTVPESLLNAGKFPFGVEYRQTIGEKEFYQLSPLERQDVMTRRVVLDGTGIPSQDAPAADGALTALPCETAYRNLTQENGLLKAEEGAEILVHVKEDLSSLDFQEGELYLYLEGVEACGPGGTGRIEAGGKRLAVHNAQNIYTTGQKDQLVKLEEISQDISLKLAEGVSYRLGRVSVYWYDLGDAREALGELEQHSLKNLRYADGRFEADIDASGGYLFLSIPYDRAWKVYVDQRGTAAKRANVGFMAVELSAGTHHIEIVYEPLPQKIGLAAALAGVFLTGLDYVRDKKRRQFRAAAGREND